MPSFLGIGPQIRPRNRLRAGSSLGLRLGCLAAALVIATAAPARTSDREQADAVAQGEYLVNLLGCGRCHTEGYLTGTEPTGPALAGSTIGIAWTAFEGDAERPGIVFPRNLTPDPDTGLGRWREADIVRAMRTGISKDGHQNLPVMPSANYASLRLDDLRAIAAYLKSLPAVRRDIPQRIEPGSPATERYVRFGVYQFDPNRQPDGAVTERPVP